MTREQARSSEEAPSLVGGQGESPEHRAGQTPTPLIKLLLRDRVARWAGQVRCCYLQQLLPSGLATPRAHAWPRTWHTGHLAS